MGCNTNTMLEMYRVLKGLRSIFSRFVPDYSEVYMLNQESVDNCSPIGMMPEAILLFGQFTATESQVTE